jgi:glycosyltransferase involved in cell wall biosynthesis
MAPSLKLSIVTPSFNQGRFLEQTLRSVAEQDYDNVEHIVIDGASTDCSVDLLRQWQARLGYWVSEPDEGHRHALKKGFDRATGEVVAWQNADDYYEPNVFGLVMRLFAERPEVDLVFGNVRIVDEAGRRVRELRFTPTNRWASLIAGMPMHNQGAFFRRRLWDAMGGITFDDHFFDTDLFLRATRLTNGQFVHRWIGNYRCHPASGHFSGQLEHLRTDPWVIRRRYLGRWARLPPAAFMPLRLADMARRTLWHMRQGDWDYLAAGAARRLGLRRDPGGG